MSRLASALPWLRYWFSGIGLVGAAGAALLGLAPALHLLAERPLARELAAQRSADKARAPSGTPRTPAATQAEDLRRFLALFPRIETLPDELDRLHRMARASGLELQQGEYRMERRSAGPAEYRVALPVRGSYAQVRAFAGEVIGKMPIASVDALRFERRRSGDPQLEAHIRLTLHFRPAQESP